MRNPHPGRGHALSQIDLQIPIRFLQLLGDGMQNEQLQSCAVATCDVSTYHIFTVFQTSIQQIICSHILQLYHPPFLISFPPAGNEP